MTPTTAPMISILTAVFINKTMKLQCYMIHSSLLLIPKQLIFPKQNVQMSSQQPSGDSKTLIMDSQQPPADSHTINIELETCKCCHHNLLEIPKH